MTGALICADGGFAPLWDALKNKEAELVCWPKADTGKDKLNDPIPKDKVQAWQMHYILANFIRPLTIYMSNSMIVDADGKILA